MQPELELRDRLYQENNIRPERAFQILDESIERALDGI